MCQSGATFGIGITLSVQNISWVDSHFDFGCNTSYYTSLFNVSLWKGVRAFFNGLKVI